jgi:hypothetical protein
MIRCPKGRKALSRYELNREIYTWKTGVTSSWQCC